MSFPIPAGLMMSGERGPPDDKKKSGEPSKSAQDEKKKTTTTTKKTLKKSKSKSNLSFQSLFGKSSRLVDDIEVDFPWDGIMVTTETTVTYEPNPDYMSNNEPAGSMMTALDEPKSAEKSKNKGKSKDSKAPKPMNDFDFEDTNFVPNRQSSVTTTISGGPFRGLPPDTYRSSGPYTASQYFEPPEPPEPESVEPPEPVESPEPVEPVDENNELFMLTTIEDEESDQGTESSLSSNDTNAVRPERRVTFTESSTTGLSRTSGLLGPSADRNTKPRFGESGYRANTIIPPKILRESSSTSGLSEQAANRNNNLQSRGPRQHSSTSGLSSYFNSAASHNTNVQARGRDDGLNIDVRERGPRHYSSTSGLSGLRPTAPTNTNLQAEGRGSGVCSNAQQRSLSQLSSTSGLSGSSRPVTDRDTNLRAEGGDGRSDFDTPPSNHRQATFPRGQLRRGAMTDLSCFDDSSNDYEDGMMDTFDTSNASNDWPQLFVSKNGRPKLSAARFLNTSNNNKAPRGLGNASMIPSSSRYIERTRVVENSQFSARSISQSGTSTTGVSNASKHQQIPAGGENASSRYAQRAPALEQYQRHEPALDGEQKAIGQDDGQDSKKPTAPMRNPLRNSMQRTPTMEQQHLSGLPIPRTTGSNESERRSTKLAVPGYTNKSQNPSVEKYQTTTKPARYSDNNKDKDNVGKSRSKLTAPLNYKRTLTPPVEYPQPRIQSGTSRSIGMYQASLAASRSAWSVEANYANEVKRDTTPRPSAREQGRRILPSGRSLGSNNENRERFSPLEESSCARTSGRSAGNDEGNNERHAEQAASAHEQEGSAGSDKKSSVVSTKGQTAVPVDDLRVLSVERSASESVVPEDSLESENGLKQTPPLRLRGGAPSMDKGASGTQRRDKRGDNDDFPGLGISLDGQNDHVWRRVVPQNGEVSRSVSLPWIAARAQAEPSPGPRGLSSTEAQPSPTKQEQGPTASPGGVHVDVLIDQLLKEQYRGNAKSAVRASSLSIAKRSVSSPKVSASPTTDSPSLETQRRAPKIPYHSKPSASPYNRASFGKSASIQTLSVDNGATTVVLENYKIPNHPKDSKASPASSSTPLVATGYGHRIYSFPANTSPQSAKEESRKAYETPRLDTVLFFTTPERENIAKLVQATDSSRPCLGGHENCSECANLKYSFLETQIMPTTMAPEERQKVIQNNRSLRTIKTELENLLGNGAVDDATFETIMAALPNESSPNAPSNTVASRASTTTKAPTAALSNLSLNSDAPPPSYPTTASTPSLPARSPSITETPHELSRATALYRYAGTDSGDCQFNPGDEIAVLEYVNADWWRGKNLSTGQEGLFPVNYVQPRERNTNPYGAYGNEKAYNGYGGGGYPGQYQQGLPPPGPSNPYNSPVPPMAVAEQPNDGNQKPSMVRKIGGKLGNAAIFGAGATLGGDLVNAII